MDDEQFANCEHGEDCCGNCLCNECDYEINVNMMLFDVTSERIRLAVESEASREDAYRSMLNNNLSESDQASVTATFDMLWPGGG